MASREMRSMRSILALIATLAACESNIFGKEDVTLTLSMTGSGSGSLVASPPGPSYSQGAVVSITASPASGSAFTGWQGDCEESKNPCAITMSTNRSVTAVFAPSTGVGQYNGAFAGNWSGGQSSGANLSGPFTLSITNGIVQGDFAPISGSQRAFSGTVSASGAITGNLPAASNGCAVALEGQITTSQANGVTVATAQGAYTLLQSATCNTASGSWSATRQIVSSN